MNIEVQPRPPLLHNGDRLKQPEFHRRYLAQPGSEKVELIGGIVYVASPVSWPHGEYHSELNTLLGSYKWATPGVRVGSDATAILGEESEPRPDLSMRIEPECGGQARINQEGYLEGAPELLAEVAYSSVALDLNQKREDYQQAGVREYIVACIEERQLRWFDFAAGDEIRPNRKGVFCSRVFPGLWIDAEALFNLDSAQLVASLEQGLASRAHTAFVRHLEQARRRGGA